MLLIFIPYFTYAQTFEQTKNYRVNYCTAKNDKNNLIGIRSFEDDLNREFLLLVNPETLETKVDLASEYKTTNCSIDLLSEIYSKSVYIKSLLAASLNDAKLQNAGIDRINSTQNGINLTVDLCPSTKPLDRNIFESIFVEFKKIQEPVPIAVSVSGKWMLKHQDDLNWLKSLVKHNELNITWINHTYSHEVNALPLKENFLLSAGIDLNFEILENEKLMLKNGIIPSVFFRFPGLVSDANLVKKIEAYGLMPIGSDAWLAKGQIARKGSIVLIHGNGNEEIGVKDFIKLLKKNRVEVANHSWLLLDLRTSLSHPQN